VDSEEIGRERKAEEKKWARNKSGDPELVAERNEIKAALRKILQHGDEADLEAVMLEFGLSENSQEWAATKKLWRSELGRHRR
jgi:hypothetical protein